MKRLKSTFLLASASVAIITLAACSDAGTATTSAADAAMMPTPTPTVSVLTASVAPVTIWDELPGRVSPYRIAEIRPQVAGLITRQLFEEGSQVKAGQPLFQIDPATFLADVASSNAALSKANAALSQATSEKDRAQSLINGNNISQQRFDEIASRYVQVHADVMQAKAALDKAQISLDQAEVKAPIDGQIGSALIGEGALANPQGTSSMATIQQIDQVYVDVRQPAARLEQIRAEASQGLESAQGIPVTVLAGTGRQTAIEGSAVFSDITVDPGTGNVNIRVVVDNKDRRLLPGMFVRALVARGTDPAAILLPQQAVVRDLSGNPNILIVDADNNAVSTPVELGELVDGQYIIRSGVAVGDRVVIEGQDRVPAGGPVVPTEFVLPTPNTDA